MSDPEKNEKNIHPSQEAYFDSMWFVSWAEHGLDWMCRMWKEPGNGYWQFSYRFRYYSDPMPWADSDHKSWYTGRTAEGATVDDARKGIMLIYTEMIEGRGPHGKPEDHDHFRIDGGTEALLKILEKKPWAHVKKITPPEMVN